MTVLKKNLNEEVYNSLKKMIVQGELKPGEKLVETNLSNILNASRTPIRDALRRLERENLVSMEPSHRAEVTKLSRQTIINLYECRAVLEGLAVRQASKYIKEKDLELINESIYLAENYYNQSNMKKTVEKNTYFHDKLIELSNNSPLIQMMENIRTQILRYRILTSSFGFRPEFLKEHKNILEAVSNNEQTLAQSLMNRHIQADLDNFLEGMRDLY